MGGQKGTEKTKQEIGDKRIMRKSFKCAEPFYQGSAVACQLGFFEFLFYFMIIRFNSYSF